MRFAGSKIEEFMPMGTDFGKIASYGAQIRGFDTVKNINRQGDMLNSGIAAAGDFEAGKLRAKAGDISSAGQSQADMISTIGGAVAGGISGFSKLGSNSSYTPLSGEPYKSNFDATSMFTDSLSW